MIFVFLCSSFSSAQVKNFMPICDSRSINLSNFSSSRMDNLLRRIRELDRRRIEYFLHAPNTLMQTFEREMREAIGKLSQEIPLNVGAGTRAYLLGKILNIGPDYETKCEEMLEQSLRANSTRADAWLELGQCAWKRADLDKAHSCFMQALERDRSAKGLCLLSAALRAKAGRETEAAKRIQLLGRALTLCQEALEKRKDYAFAWYSLGNTQLARFFALQQIQERDLSLALDSFSNALKSPASFSSSSSSAVEDGRRPFINPDLHLNYGQALYYNQDYAMALAQFRQALAIEPHFVQARQQFEGALAYLGQLREAIRRKGRLSQHRLNALLDSFRQQSLPISAQIKLTTKNGRNGIHGPTAECSTLDELRSRITETKSVASAPSNGEHQKKPNPNNGNVLAQNFVLSVRCVGQMGNGQPIPVTLICVDRSGQAVGLCVYNCSTKFGALIGDLLTIYNPRLILVKIKDLGLDDVQSNKKEQKMEAKIAESKEGEEEEEEVVLLRITNPRRQLLKNGQPLAADCCAFASLSVETQNVAAAAADGQLEMEAEDQGHAPNPTSTKCSPSVKASGRHRRRK